MIQQLREVKEDHGAGVMVVGAIEAEEETPPEAIEGIQEEETTLEEAIILEEAGKIQGIEVRAKNIEATGGEMIGE